MLLSVTAESLGADMDDYALPGDRVREWLDGTAPGQVPADPEIRRLQVLAAVESGAGELG